MTARMAERLRLRAPLGIRLRPFFFAVLALVGLPAVAGPLWPGSLPPLTGDEPHYLMMTISLERDHDFAVANNYADDQARELAHPRLPLPAGNPTDSTHSLHYPGTALLALPGWLVGGRRWAVLGQAVVATFLLREMFLLGRLFGVQVSTAVLAVATVAMTPPVLLLSRQIYPEIPIALVTTHLARRLAESRVRPTNRSFMWWTSVAVAVSVVPWFHVRGILPAMPLWAAISWRTRGWLRVLPVAAFATSLATMGFFFREWYGHWLPTAPYKDFPTRGPYPARAFIGLLTDGHAGLLFAAPIVVLSLVVIPLVWRSDPLWSSAFIAAWAISLAVTARFTFWHGGGSTMGRFWASLLPLATPLVAKLFVELRLWAILVGSIGAAMGAYLLVETDLAYPDSSAMTGIWRQLHATFVPIIDTPGRASSPPRGSAWYCAIALLVVIAVIAALALRLAHRQAENSRIMAN